MNHVEVHQITSIGNDVNLAYMNVKTSYGSVSVDTFIPDHPTIIARHTKYNQNRVYFIVFDSEEYFEEWKEQNKDYKFERIEQWAIGK